MNDQDYVINTLNKAAMGVFSKLTPATRDEVDKAQLELGFLLPISLKYFYQNFSNGIVFGRFKIIPILSKANLKKTAESIVRVNSVNHSAWFNEDIDTINRYMIFCTEDSEICYCIARSGGDFVWQWRRGWDSVKELDYDFWGWFKESLRLEKGFLFN